MQTRKANLRKLLLVAPVIPILFSFGLPSETQPAYAANAKQEEELPICRRYEDSEKSDTGCNDLQIVILIDDSASMLTNDPDGVRFDGVIELIDVLAERHLISREDNALNPPDFQVAAVHFGTSVGFNSGWHQINPENNEQWEEQRTQLIQELDINQRVKNLTATNFIQPFNAAKNLFDAAASPEDRGCPERFILLLTDGLPSTDQIKTRADVEDHMQQVEQIAAQIFSEQERNIYVTALSESGSDYWGQTADAWANITQDNPAYALARAALVPNVQTLAGRISHIIAENVGLKNIFLDADTTVFVPQNVEKLRIAHFSPEIDTRLEIIDPAGQRSTVEIDTLRTIHEIENPDPGVYTLNSTSTGSSINLIFKYADQVIKYVPPNLSQLRFTYTINPELAANLLPAETAFTVDGPDTGVVYESIQGEEGAQTIVINNPSAGSYLLNGSFSDGTVHTVFEYPQRITQFERTDEVPLQQFTETELSFQLLDKNKQPLTFNSPARFLISYTLPGDSASREAWVQPDNGIFTLPLLPLESGAGNLKTQVISSDVNGNDCLLHETRAQNFLIDRVFVNSAETNADGVCVPIGDSLEAALSFQLFNARTNSPTIISLPLSWRASASTDQGQTAGVNTSESDNSFNVSILPGLANSVQTDIQADVLNGNDRIPLYQETFSTSGYFFSQVRNFQITGIDWRGDNLTSPLYRFLYEISGPKGEEIMTRYKFLGWSLPTKIGDETFGDLLFGYRVMGWFGPKELEVRANYLDDSPEETAPNTDRFWVKIMEIGSGQENRYESEWLNSWEETSSGDYRILFDTPPGGIQETKGYLVRIEDRGENLACQTILPPLQRNLLIVIPYWGTIAAFLLGALHIPRLVRWLRKIFGDEEGENNDPGKTPPEMPKENDDPPKTIDDDLKIIEGIGPKVEELLKEKYKITSYAALASLNAEVIEAWLDEAGWAYMDPTSWPHQAYLANIGEMDVLEALKKVLKRGRYKEGKES